MVAIFVEIAATGRKELTRAILIGWAKAVESRAMGAPGAETGTDGTSRRQKHQVATPDVRPRLGALRRERLAVFRAARAADTVGNERKTEPWNLLWFAGCRISEASVDPVLVLR